MASNINAGEILLSPGRELLNDFYTEHTCEIDDELIELIGKEKRLTPYFDIPIQHSEDEILLSMNRRGNRQYLLNLFNKIKEKVPNAILRTTIMVGFPGETPETLRETKRQFLKLLREDRIDYFFPKLFIPYPGTEPYEKQKEYGIKLNDKWSEFARFGLQQPFKLKKFDGADLKTEMLDFYERIVECYETKNNQ